MDKKKFGLGLIFLLVVPAAFGELLANVYNLYVPIYLQSGNAAFDTQGQLLTRGFGLGAFTVGLWLIVDNLLAVLIQPWIGAWSDRIRTRLGRRLPFVLYTLPLILLGYAFIPVIPRLIPAFPDGQSQPPVVFLAVFSLACLIFYLGYIPVRVIFQTLRQEAVEPGLRSRVEAWYTFLFNLLVIATFTAGSALYRLYSPLLFWVLLVLYLVACIILLILYREPDPLAAAEPRIESSNLKQLADVFRSRDKRERSNLYLYLASVFLLTLAIGASSSFSSSWVVNVLGVNEAKASVILSVSPLALILAVLPAGYLASGKLGRKPVYIGGIAVMTAGATLISVAPSLYLPSFILMGAGSGIMYSSFLALLFDLSPQQRVSGALVGIYNVAFFLGFTLGSALIGLIIERTSYLLFYPSMLAFGVASMACALFIRLPVKAKTEDRLLDESS